MKKVINRCVSFLGYEIRRKGGTNYQPSGFTAQRISKLGAPKTIIDVGVAGGTLPLYEAFPGANLVLVEPMASRHEVALGRIRSCYPNVYIVDRAVGEAEGELKINVHRDFLSKASFLDRTALTAQNLAHESVTIRVSRLDEIMKELKLEPPYGIKIDTEGFELQVLRGTERLFAKTEFVIAEVSVAKRFQDSYTFEELIRYMDEHGFCVTDMLDFSRPDPIGTRFMDLVFKRRGG